MTKKVAIVGTAPASRLLAPFADQAWEIWGCSPGNAYGALPRVTKWFELHALAEMLAPENMAMAVPYFAWLKQESEAGRFGVVMQEQNESVPKAAVYPRDVMLEQFGHNWFTSSVAWMMALAISEMQRGDEIALFGVDMAADQEHYTAQKAGCLRFMEIAAERGINVRVPKESSLGAQTPLYGYSEGSPFGRRINAILHLVQTKRAEMAAQRDRLGLEIAFFDGALEQLRYFQRTWTDGAEVPIDTSSIQSLVAAASATATEAGRAIGAPAGGPALSPLIVGGGGGGGEVTAWASGVNAAPNGKLNGAGHPEGVAG